MTAAVAFVPFLLFAYRSARAHVALETATGLIALLVGYLMFGRYRQSGAPSDFLVTYGLGTVGFANLLFGVVPAFGEANDPYQAFFVWGALSARFAGAAALALAAWGRLPSLNVPTELPRVVLGIVAGLVVIVVLVFAVRPLLPPSPVTDFPSASSGRPLLEGHPIVHGLQLLLVCVYAAASVGFTRRAQRTNDELMTWFGAGTALAAWARVNYFLFPSVYTSYVYVGDLLRLAYFLLLLGGAAREIGRYWQGMARAAVADERRRFARDLHDGLAQELSYIASQSHRLVHSSANEDLKGLEAAAVRALDESRMAIDALTLSEHESLDVALTRVSEDITSRSGVGLRLDLEKDLDAPVPHREALLRLVREAVNNAIRHGRASTITLSLAQRDGIWLRVADDGCGFVPEEVPGGGFGLTSMRERIEALDGFFAVRSRPGRGTEIEVRVP